MRTGGGAVAIMCAVLLLAGAVAPVWAAPDVSTRAADDGTTIVEGSGWRPGQQLIVNVGQDLFPVTADSAGGFEIHTHQPFSSTGGTPVSVRPMGDTFFLASLRKATAAAEAQADAPDPLAVLFAQSLAMGSRWLALGVAAITAANLGRRIVRARRTSSDAH